VYPVAWKVADRFERHLDQDVMLRAERRAPTVQQGSGQRLADEI
jgi:hypothetical protein